MSSLLLGGALLIQGVTLRLPARACIRLTLVGLILGIHWVLFFASAKISGASVCLAGLSTQTLWSTLLKPFVTGERIQGYEAILSVAIVVGIGLIAGFQGGDTMGLLLACLAGLLGALFIYSNQVFSKGIEHRLATFYHMCGACFGSALMMGLSWLWLDKIDMRPLPADIPYLIVLSLVCTVVPYIAFTDILRRISAFAANITLNLEPLYGIILAAAFLGESAKLSKGFYFGTLIILLSVFSYPILARRHGLTSPR